MCIRDRGKPIDADALLPEQRDIALSAATPKLEKWGDRLTEALAMTDAQYEAVSEAIASGMALTDPNFPQFDGLNLDPEADAELIKAIADKGEDGPHFIDGLMDFAKYAKAKRMNKPYASYFNAYIDGKTNGLASNGIQMGSFETAMATGVIRNNRTQLLDAGDIRDQLKEINLESIHQFDWDGNTDGFLSELNDVAHHVFSYRQLNKDTTMTFGYGKEINNFRQNIEDAIGLLSEQAKEGSTYNSSLQAVEQNMDRTQLAEMLLSKYRAGLEQVLSKDAIDSRGLMRGASILHSAINAPFSIKSYTDMDLNLGGEMSLGADQAAAQTTTIYAGGAPRKVKTYHYETEATAAAPRNMENPETGEIEAVAGEYAYGGSLPGPVQSLDAATVALTAAGKSWQKLKAKSMGNPYLHTIYDAFKMDANGYDTVLEEVNQNWLDATMKWNYLDETRKATTEAISMWREKNKNRPATDKLTPNERLYMDWMTSTIPDAEGRPSMKNFVNKIKKVKQYNPTDSKANHAAAVEVSKKLAKELGSVGYNVNSPPEVATAAQQRVFVNFLIMEMGLSAKFNQMIARTNKNKMELRKRIRASGPVLQYYAH